MPTVTPKQAAIVKTITGPPAAEPVVAAMQPGPGRFRVKLKDNPEKTVEASDRLAAIEAYKIECGIIRTENPFDVIPVE